MSRFIAAVKPRCMGVAARAEKYRSTVNEEIVPSTSDVSWTRVEGTIVGWITMFPFSVAKR